MSHAQNARRGCQAIRDYEYSKQEAFEKCWAHSPGRAAARRIAIHQMSLLSHAATVARRLRIDVHNNDENDSNDNNDNA